MADGTVTGEFRLTTVQARRELERTQREGRETDRVMERAGRSMDTVGSRQQTRQVRTYHGELRRGESTVRNYTRQTERLATAADHATFGRRGGGGGAGGVRGGMLGLSGGVRLMATQAGIALPVIRALTGGIGALSTVVASAATGAGAVGAAGLVGMATGIGGIASVAVPAIKRIKEITDAQKEYNEAVKEYGRRSKEAREARGDLRSARRAGPAGAGALVLEAQAFGRAWTRATREGQESLVDFLRETVKTGQRMRRPLADIANQVTTAFTGQGRKFLRFAESDRVMKGLRAGGNVFSENLGNVRRIGQATVEMFLNVTRASRPFVKQFSDFMAGWFERQAGRTRNIRDLRRNIGDMVDDLKSVGRLGGAGGRLILALLGQTRAPGRSLLADATAQLDRWTQWINRNPAKIQTFFRQSADDVRSLASALVSIVSLLNDIAGALRPILPGIQVLANAAGAIGGVGTVGLGAALLGGVRGGRGRPAGPGVLGTLLGRGRGAGGAAAAGGGAAAARGGFGRAAGGALMGAGRAYWPIAAAMAGLTAVGTEGGLMRRGQAAASSLTFGLINAPRSFEEIQQEGAESIGGIRPPGSLRGARGALRGNVAERQRLQELFHRGRVVERPGFGPGTPIERTRVALGDEERERVRGQIEQLKANEEALRDNTRMLRDVRAAREVARAPAVARDVRGAFRFRRGRGADVAEAGRAMGRDLAEAMGQQLTRRGKRAVAQANLGWLQEQRKRSPAFERLYDDMVRRVTRRFRRLGLNIEVINGRIFTSTKAAWRNIAASIGGATERAKQDASEDFTTLQNRAVRSLQQMGWSKREAQRIISSQESSQRGTPAARGGRWSVTHRDAPGAGSGLVTQNRPRARGGRLSGRGLQDNVPMVDGSRAAPGELVVNRHTEAKHDRDAQRFGLPTLAARVGRETTPHSAPRRKPRTDVYHRHNKRLGDLVGQAAGSANLQGADPGLIMYAALARQYGLSVTSGYRGGSITSSGNVSLHSSGDAIDIGGGQGQMLAFARVMANRYGAGLDELIHTPLGFGIKNGARVPPYAAADHYDHVHVGDRSPGGARGLPGGAMIPGGVVPGIRLRPVQARGRGAPGGMVQGANNAAARGMQRIVNRRIGAGAVPGGGQVSAGGAFGKARLANLWTMAGGSPQVANLMAAIALAESGGNPAARNPSGASGLWQILGNPFPGNPMDPMTNAKMAVSKYRSQGLGAWEAYTRGMHSKYMAKGGRVGPGFRGWFRNGGSFTAHHPQLVGVGDGVGSEQVTIGKRGGGGGINVNVNMGSVHVASVGEAGSVGDQIGTQVAKKIAAALREAPLTAAA